MGVVLASLGQLTLLVCSENYNDAVLAFDPSSGQSMGTLASLLTPSSNIYYSLESPEAIASWEALPQTTIYVASNSFTPVVFSLVFGYGNTVALTPLVISSATGGFAGPISLNGLVCDANYLYVLTAGHAVYRYNRATGAPAGLAPNASTGLLIASGTSGLGSAGGQVDPNQGMALGPDGNLYIAEGNTVLSFSASTGAFLSSFVVPTGTISTIAFDALGDMYILVMQGNSGGILKYSGTSGQPKGAGGIATDPTLVPMGNNGLAPFGGMCISADLETLAATVYVTSEVAVLPGAPPDIADVQVMTFDGVSGQFLQILVPYGNGATQSRAMMLTHTFSPSYPYPVGPDNNSNSGGSGGPAPPYLKAGLSSPYNSFIAALKAVLTWIKRPR